MARAIAVFALANCVAFAALSGCREVSSEDPEPKIYVRLEGRTTRDGMTPGFWFTSRGGAYGKGMSDTRVLEGQTYKGKWLYSGELEEDPKPENLLIGVYGCAAPGTNRLARLVIETNIESKLVLVDCEEWRVILERNNRPVPEPYYFGPGKHVLHISPKEPGAREEAGP